METKEYRNITDRTGWPDGPWDDEPDKLQWQDPDTGLPCLIKRNRWGALCGYVGVPRGHTWYGKHYDDVNPDPPVHGGLTYADKCQTVDIMNDPHGTLEEEAGHLICHLVEAGEPDDVWWLGFDCGHFMDTQPGMLADLRLHGIVRAPYPHETYKDVGYVREECRLLAQAATDQFGKGNSRRRLWPDL